MSTRSQQWGSKMTMAYEVTGYWIFQIWVGIGYVQFHVWCQIYLKRQCSANLTTEY
uniref:Uncharacterized protein n=1 Tax=Anguilla anguilla TaxID=7936 RepID=A0A0E9U9V8_ANGAN